MAMDSFEYLQRDIISVIWNTNDEFLETLMLIAEFQQKIQKIVLYMPEGVQHGPNSTSDNCDNNVTNNELRHFV
ncbi:GH22354 [Drosophila grimshawi]|uniref:GH22354 n=1 Tax=Drosophila grimshawi TaxID=7222 RepID=B4JYS2_DROGR|nr:GH22354 [Drosophila grimshawi]